MKTKGDGMERRAERWLRDYSAVDIWTGIHHKSLTRLLRKVAREAAMKQSDRSAKIAKDYHSNFLCDVDCSGGIELAILNDKARESA